MDFPTPDPEDALAPGADEALMGAADPAADQESAEADLSDRLQMFGAKLAQRRDEWVRARASQGHDKRWSEDADQFNGKDSSNRAAASMMTSVEQGFPVTSHHAAPTRSTVFVQVTRQKTNALAARIGDIVLPTDEPNFSIKPGPAPVLPSFVHLQSPQQQPQTAPGSGGNQVAAPDGAQGASNTAPLQTSPIDQATQQLLDQYTAAKQRSDLMQAKIEEALDECDFNAEVRKVIYNAVLFGVGVLKGPCVVNRTRKAWVQRTDATGQKTWVLDQVAELSPASFSLDPRRFYPDPLCGENVQNGRGAFEYEKKTVRQVRDLKKQPGYMRSQLIQVIEEGAKPARALTTTTEMEDQDFAPGDLYEHWTYWGEVDRDDLEAAGVELEGDELDSISACVEMINNTVVRAYHNPLPDGALPYDVFPLERIPGSVLGFGVPYLMRAQQRVINAAWRMTLDNAGVSSGPQIVIKPGSIQPADKQWTLTSRKLWYASEDVDDVSKAFATFEFENHQNELMQIIQLAERLSDEETAVPLLMAGDKGQTPETVGGMAMVMNNTNTMLRRVVKMFDDYLTKPHIRRYYDYLMEYDPDENIKGDYQIVALGSSALVVRDIQNQAFTNLLALGTNPAYATLINLKKLFEKALRAQHIDPTDVMNTDAQVAMLQQQAAKNQQPDPRVAAAQFRAKADEERTQAQVQMNEQTLQVKEKIAEDTLQFQRESLEIQRQIEMLRLAQKENVSLETIRAQLASVSIRERTKQDMKAMELNVQAAPGGAAKPHFG